MSLLSIRRERRQLGSGEPSRPPALWKLLAALAIVVYVIWYLGKLS